MAFSKIHPTLYFITEVERFSFTPHLWNTFTLVNKTHDHTESLSFECTNYHYD